MKFRTLFFDLDDTLYPSGNGLWDAIRDRMNLYMVERLSIPESEVAVLRRTYYETYGTTLKGLQYHYAVDTEDFLEFVHDLPLKEYLKPDPELRKMLENLPQSKWIFTNADRSHARRVLEELELVAVFDGVIDVKAVEYACKPEPDAYRRALALAGETEPERSMFLDDSIRNLKPAFELGIFTVLVGTTEPHSSARLSLHRLKDLPLALPELFNRYISYR
jgi:putative hydrolase of the HAD superfamily